MAAVATPITAGATAGTGWRPLPRPLRGIALAAFQPPAGAGAKPFVPLQLGDIVQILEECAGWSRGFVFAATSFSADACAAPALGVFPTAVIHIRELAPRRSLPASLAGTMGPPLLPKRRSGQPSSNAIAVVGSTGSIDGLSTTTTGTAGVPEKAAKSMLRKSSIGSGGGGNGSLAPPPPVPPLPAGLVATASTVPGNPQMAGGSAPRPNPSGTTVNDPNAPDARTTWPTATHPTFPTHVTAAAAQDPVIDECAAALRDWNVALRQQLLLQRYRTTAAVRQLFDVLVRGRRQLLMEALSADEAAKVRRDLLAVIDHGNSLLGISSVLRHPDRGFLLSEENASLSRLYRAQFLLARPPGITGDADAGGENMAGQSASSVALKAAFPLHDPHVHIPLSAGLARPLVDADGGGPKTCNLYCDFALPDLRAAAAAGVLPALDADDLVEVTVSVYSHAKAPGGRRGFVSDEFMALTGADGRPRNTARLLQGPAFGPAARVADVGRAAGEKTDGEPARITTVFTGLGAAELAEPGTLHLVVRLVRYGRAIPGEASLTAAVRRPLAVGVLDLGALAAGIATLADYGVRLVGCASESGFGTLFEQLIDKREAYATAVLPVAGGAVGGAGVGGSGLAAAGVPGGHNGGAASLATGASAGSAAGNAGVVALGAPVTVNAGAGGNVTAGAAPVGQRTSTAPGSGPGLPLFSGGPGTAAPVTPGPAATATGGPPGTTLPPGPAAVMTACLCVWAGERGVLAKQLPMLSREVAFTNRRGFADAFVQGGSEDKNTLYVTACDADLASIGKRLNVRAFETRIEVRWLERAAPGAAAARDQWVFGAEAIAHPGLPRTRVAELVTLTQTLTPRWNETVQLEIPPAVHGRAHLFITFSHSNRGADPGKTPFAFAVLPLKRGEQMLGDGLHELALFRYDEQLVQIPAMYLALPLWLNAPPDPPADIKVASVSAQSFAQNHLLKDIVRLRTELCSTKLSQNPGLLGLLQCKSAPEAPSAAARPIRSAEAQQILQTFRSTVGSVDMVRFLAEILDALFSLLAGSANAAGELDMPVIETLSLVLESVAGNKASRSRAAVETYTDESFYCPGVWRSLMQGLLQVVGDPGAQEYTTRLVKSWHYVMRLIVRSHAQSRRLITSGDSAEAAMREIDDELREKARALLEAVAAVVSSTASARLIAAQSTAIQNFGNLVTELAPAFDAAELVRHTVRFVDAVHATKFLVQVHRMTMIHTLMRNQLFRDPRGRIPLVHAMIRWISECLCGAWDPAAPPPGHLRDESSTRTQGDGLAASVATALKERDAQREMIRLCICLAADLIDWATDLITEGLPLEAAPGNAGGVASGVAAATNPAGTAAVATRRKTLPNDTLRPSADDVGRVVRGMVDLLPVLINTLYDVILVGPLMVAPELSGVGSSLPRHATGRDAGSALAALATPVATTTDVMELGIVVVSLLHFLARPAAAVSAQGGRQLRAFFLRFSEDHGRPSAGELAFKSLFVLQILNGGRVYMREWTAIRMLVAKVSFGCLTDLAPVLDELFSGLVGAGSTSGDLDSPAVTPVPRRTSHRVSTATLLGFYPRLWAEFFRTVVVLLNGDLLSLESASEQGRRLVSRMRADVRPALGRLLAERWQHILSFRAAAADQVAETGPALGESYRAFVSAVAPALVVACLEMLLSPSGKLCDTAGALLLSVLEDDATEDDGRAASRRLNVVLIESIDSLVIAQQRGVPAARWRIVSALARHVRRPASPARARSRASLLREAVQYLELCFQVRELPGGREWDDERIAAMLQLLAFIRRIDRHDMYVRYIRQLASMQLVHNNPTEAACLLRMHADTLPWSAPAKRALYEDMLFLCERGGAWESAALLCQEWRSVAEAGLDYATLAALLSRQAALYRRIVSEERFPCTYFRVGFYGAAWPRLVRGRQFVYRGDAFEKISAFVERMLNRYSGAQLVKGNAPVPAEMQAAPERYLQIVAVKPEPVRLWAHRRRGRQLRAAWSPSEALDVVEHGYFDLLANGPQGRAEDIPPFVQTYYEHNEVLVFSFERPFKRPLIGRSGKPFSVGSSNEFLELWTEKTALVIETALPSLLRRSRVVHERRVESSPVENALLTMLNKNRELAGLEVRYSAAAVPTVASGAVPVGGPAVQPVASPPVGWSQGGTVRGGGGLLSSLSASFAAPAAALGFSGSAAPSMGHSAAPSFSVGGGADPMAALAGTPGSSSVLMGGAAASATSASTGTAQAAAAAPAREINLNPLTMSLNGAVDAPVNGGVTMYKEAFLGTAFATEFPEMAPLVAALRAEILEQTRLLERCLALHQTLVPKQMEPLHWQLVSLFERNFATELETTRAERGGVSLIPLQSSPGPQGGHATMPGAPQNVRRRSSSLESQRRFATAPPATGPTLSKSQSRPEQLSSAAATGGSGGTVRGNPSGGRGRESSVGLSVSQRLTMLVSGGLGGSATSTPVQQPSAAVNVDKKLPRLPPDPTAGMPVAPFPSIPEHDGDASTSSGTGLAGSYGSHVGFGFASDDGFSGAEPAARPPLVADDSPKLHLELPVDDGTENHLLFFEQVLSAAAGSSERLDLGAVALPVVAVPTNYASPAPLRPAMAAASEQSNDTAQLYGYRGSLSGTLPLAAAARIRAVMEPLSESPESRPSSTSGSVVSAYLAMSPSFGDGATLAKAASLEASDSADAASSANPRRGQRMSTFGNHAVLHHQPSFSQLRHAWDAPSATGDGASSPAAAAPSSASSSSAVHRISSQFSRMFSSGSSAD